MTVDHNAFNQIATTLARQYVTLYYVEIESGNYTKFGTSNMFKNSYDLKQGEDFFALALKYVQRFIHPSDLKRVSRFHDRERVLEKLSHNDSYSVCCRLISDQGMIHIRQIYMMCDDKKHLICGIENIENEVHEKEEHKKNLHSAEKMARLDGLTGIKNITAFKECSEMMDQKIGSDDKELQFSIVMCDMNDLKLINDTRGHSFGDEAIRRTSRIICEIFKHSPVFRVGGDEFVVVLTGCDFKHRDSLLNKLKAESEANSRMRSGPVIACGMADYVPGKDKGLTQVLERADGLMYENKSELKSRRYLENFRDLDSLDIPITDERKRMLDGLFDAFYTMAGEGYVYLNDMHYDYSRWSAALIDDFGLESEYMYHAGKIWQEYIHPDDLEVYKKALNIALCESGEIRPIRYRARKPDGTYKLLSTRAFVLFDKDGKPEYFGGLIIPQS